MCIRDRDVNEYFTFKNPDDGDTSQSRNNHLYNMWKVIAREATDSLPAGDEADGFWDPAEKKLIDDVFNNQYEKQRKELHTALEKFCEETLVDKYNNYTGTARPNRRAHAKEDDAEGEPTTESGFLKSELLNIKDLKKREGFLLTLRDTLMNSTQWEGLVDDANEYINNDT